MLRPTFAVPFAFAAVGLTGCLLTVEEDGDGVGGFGGDDVTATTKASTVTTTTTASTTASTNTATSDASTSTGNQCVGPDGTGLGASECDEVAGNLSECPSSGQPPVAGLTCDRGYQIFSAGSWENLLACLKAIPFNIPDLCDEPTASDHVADCTDEMYAEACPNAFADQTCSDVATVVCGSEGGFDEASCKSQLVPFSTAGINAYRTCIDESGAVACSSLHETCLTQVISF